MSVHIWSHMILVLLLGQQALVIHTLSVTPASIYEPEDDNEVHFFCYESDNLFATDITWRGPGGDLYTPDDPSAEGERVVAEGGRLTIYDLVRGDSGRYECFRSGQSAHGELFVYAPPVIFNRQPVQEIYNGVTSLLVCQMDRGHPTANVVWVRVDYDEMGEETYSYITPSSHPRFEIVENGLQIADVRSEDEGVYRCHVHNSYGVDKLDIHAAFRAPPQFVNPDVELNINQTVGQSVLLDCAAASAPRPNHTWTVPPNSQSAQGSPLTDSSLNVQLSDESDAGEYICTVQNGVGTISRIFIVKIATPPRPPVKYRNLTIALDKPTDINCSVTAYPQPNFRWSHGSGREPFPDYSWTSTYDGEMSISNFRHIFIADDLGRDCAVLVVCVAENGYGTSKQHFKLSPSDTDNCPHDMAIATDPSDPSPPIIATNDQVQEGSEDTNGGKMDDSLGIIVGVSITSTLIVVGVLVLLMYFLKHFGICSRTKATKNQDSHLQQLGTNENYRNNTFTDGTISMTSSLHHGGTSALIHSEGGGHASVAGHRWRLRSVDSGVSISSTSSLISRRTSHDSATLPPTPSSANLSPHPLPVHVPTGSYSNVSCSDLGSNRGGGGGGRGGGEGGRRGGRGEGGGGGGEGRGGGGGEGSGVGGGRGGIGGEEGRGGEGRRGSGGEGGGEGEGFYHRLNHNLPYNQSCTSFSSSVQRVGSRPIPRLSSTSSNLPLLQSQSSSELEDSFTSTDSAFVQSRAGENHQRRLLPAQQCSNSLSADQHVAVSDGATYPDANTHGMYPNLAYETRKFALSTNQSDTTPHIYERVT